MADIYRAVRQFERTFLPNLNPNEPPDDRKTQEDMMLYPRHIRTSSEYVEGKLIATMVFIKHYDSKGNLTNIETRVERHV